MKISEIFSSIQGEGPWTGRLCTFIRTSGCNLACSWCDTKFANEISMEIEIDNLLDTVNNIGNNYIVITGGEPTIQDDLQELIEALEMNDYCVGIESNGIKRDVIDDIANNTEALIVICPKTIPLLMQYKDSGYTLKYVVDPNRIKDIGKAISQHNMQDIYLMPLGIEPEEIILGSYAIIEMIKTYKLNCTLSTRLHILLGVK